jgi:hypothetical protein
MAISPPEDEVGRELPGRRRLCRNRTAAAWLMTLTVYSTGFTVEVGGYFRPGEVGHRRDWFGYRLGVTLSDERQATSLDEHDHNQPPSAPLIRMVSSMGVANHVSMSWWIHGIPPPGELWVHFGWPCDGYRTNTIELDAAPIRKLSSA